MQKSVSVLEYFYKTLKFKFFFDLITNHKKYVQDQRVPLKCFFFLNKVLLQVSCDHLKQICIWKGCKRLREWERKGQRKIRAKSVLIKSTQ